MSTVAPKTIAERLSFFRMESYLAAAQGDLSRALALYDWNIAIGAAFYEDIARLEVVLRNALDAALVTCGATRRWPTVWYQRTQLFPGKHGRRALEDIDAARTRAVRKGGREVHGTVIAELSFGFWRYLCTPAYLTSMWGPALGAAFSHHPQFESPHLVRKDVERRVERIHFLRNRIAHHEPIHQRDLARDRAGILDVCGWICGETRAWVELTSRSDVVLAQRPGPS